MQTATSALPPVGRPAPDFTLPSTAGREISLSEYRGRATVVLAFFPLASTGVCTDELCSFSDGLPDFAEADTVVLGISVDSVPTLEEFRRKEGITVELLSDFRRDVCRRYGTLDEELFSSRRAYVVVDRAGIVRWTHVEPHPGQRRENDELLTVVRGLV
jgi:peroxiredoxin